MGMITRVRGRLQSVSYTKLSVQYYHEEKFAQTACLLSMIVLMPYFGSGACSLPILVLICTWISSYSALDASFLSLAREKYHKYQNDLKLQRSGQPSAEFQWIANCIEATFANCRCFIDKHKSRVLGTIQSIYKPIEKLEEIIFQMKNFFTLLNQIIFFLVCDRYLNWRNAFETKSQERVTSLYSLIFYNVISYCVYYIKDLIEKETWSPYVHISSTSNVKHLAMSATKIVLEFTKAVTFIMTIIFMLLVFGLEQKLDNYQPNVYYTMVTALFYVTSEKIFVDLILKLFVYLQLDKFESMEALYLPVYLQYFAIGMAMMFTTPLLLYFEGKLIFLSVYVNMYLRYKSLLAGDLKKLQAEQKALVPFRYATKDELTGFDDICAVCLSAMKVARITPCHHLFHANCLRLWLSNSNTCPICKQEYIYS